MKINKKLIINNLSKTFQSADLEVLKNVSLHVNDGELVSLLGPSGCGKSTFLDIIAGLTKANEGEILLDKKSILGKPGKVAYMMQDDNLFPWRNVLDNVIIPLEISGTKKNAAREEAKKLLPIFGLEKFAAYFPFMLSGGMRQRVALVRTYLCKKDILLLDEPFARLDAITRKQMQEWFLQIWQQDKRSVLFVTHDVDEAIFLSDKIYVMSKRPGKIIDEIIINMPRPRKANVYNSRKFFLFKKSLLQVLEN